VIAAAAALLAACGSGSGPGPGSGGGSGQPTRATPSDAHSALASWPCLAGVDATAVQLPGKPALTVATLGSGRRTVVLVNQSDQNLCSWLGYAKTLVGAGLRVVLYDYVTAPADDLLRVSGYLRAHGTSVFAFVGASQGAKAAIIAAVTVHPRAVVSLSAENALQGTAVAPYAARLTAPTLFVTSADDPYGATAATRGFDKAAPTKLKQLVVVPGAAHGTALLADPAIAREVTTFLDRYDR